MREEVLGFTSAAVTLLNGYARVGYTVEAVWPIVRRAEELARERGSKRIGKADIIKALDQLSREDEQQQKAMRDDEISIIEANNGVVRIDVEPDELIVAAYGDVVGVTMLQVQSAEYATVLATMRSWELDSYLDIGAWPQLPPFMREVERLWSDYRKFHPQK